jgi:hypothetical protein
MPLDRLNSGFDAIRPWRGSTARGFEELCYQLFESTVPEGTRAIRTGNPDGGVEWYATLADGTELGWQAKHVHDVDSLLVGMTESVRAVVRDRPKVVRLTFLISSNLATATGGSRRKSQRQKYDDKVDFWRTSIEGAAEIDFELVQESDILSRLSLPEHEGRRWFWWGETEFTDAWLSQRLREQIDVAGEKYRPDLQVDLPIENDLAALRFDAGALDRLDQLRRGVVSEAGDYWITKKGSDELIEAYAAIEGLVVQLKVAASALHVQPSTVESDLGPLRTLSEALSRAVNAASELEYVAESEWRESNPDQDRYAVQANSPYEARGHRTRRLVDRVSELERWLDSTAGQALQRGHYFLEGVAGSGKTHLLLEATQQALQEERPAVFLSAARFGRGDLWSGVCDQLGLPPVGADTLLGAMDAAAEAAALAGCRFLIALDALNETTDTDFWRTYLPALRAAVARWPHVALVVSCRDTYVGIVSEDSERRQFVGRMHPGFAGHEIDATQRFFAFHGLQAPRIPLLVPEFSLPLFLKLFCEGLKESGETAYGGHQGRVTIFQRYLDSKLVRVARRFRPQAASSYEQSAALRAVRAVLDALLDEFAVTGQEGVSVSRAEELTAKALGDAPSIQSEAVLGALQSEGVLNQELLYLGDRITEQGFRIVFQALADYMILRRRLERSDDGLTDNAVHHWLKHECSWGILEAASVVLPELHSVELPDLLGIRAKDLQLPDTNDHDARREYNRTKHIALSVIRSLPYREAAAVTDRTVELLNESLRFVRPDELFRVMFLIAPQPGNQLNGDRLHRHLARFRMPDRDVYFGIPTYYELADENSAGSALARWASKGPYPDYDPNVIELAAIPLVWLLLSPNRYMRDWITKALVALLRGHLDVVERLVARFWTVNDPYIVQRVIVIAYGALLRSNAASQPGHAKKLVARVGRLVFAEPVRADEILLDAARGVIEWGVANGVASKAQLKASRRPYGLKPPGPVSSEDTLEKKYGWKDGQPDKERYSGVLHSLLSFGDFGRYVIEPGVETFSQFPVSRPYPELNTDADKAVSIVRSRWAKFVKSLDSSQHSKLDALLAADSAEALDRVEAIRSGFSSSLSYEQSQLFRDSFKRPRRRRFRDDAYPADRAKRWVFMQVLRFGWTPNQFGEADGHLGRGVSGREAHKAERWGKKYQWMAYHALLARIADNFHSARRYSDHHDYEGLHQIIADREIDSSLPPVPFHQFLEPETGNDTWRPSPITFSMWPPASISFQQLGGSLTRFLCDVQSEPTLDKVVLITDASGDLWVVLDANLAQGDPEADKSWRGLQQSFYLNSWFVQAGTSENALRHLPATIRNNRHDLIDTHGHVDCCYFGEIGWVPHHCSHRHAELAEVDIDGASLTVVSTVEDYLWEGSLYDCSIGESVNATLPSTFIRSRSSLTTDERGPSWMDNDHVAFTNYVATGRDHQRAFLARADWLSAFMTANNVEVVLAASTLRWRVTGDYHHSKTHNPERDDRLDVYSAARLMPDLQMEFAPSIREANGEEVNPCPDGT